MTRNRFPTGNTAMTAAELKKLETIIGKLEALQNQTKDQRAADKMGQAKSLLLTALRS